MIDICKDYIILSHVITYFSHILIYKKWTSWDNSEILLKYLWSYTKFKLLVKSLQVSFVLMNWLNF